VLGIVSMEHGQDTLPAIDFHRHTTEVHGSRGRGIIERWRPVFRLHTSARYAPISIDDYIRRCEVPRWDDVILTNSSRLLPRMDVLEAEADLMEPTVHAFIRRVSERTHPCYGCLVVFYVLLFANQRDVALCHRCYPLGGTGHEADVEWVALLLDDSGAVLRWTFYSAHGTAESSWVPQHERRPVAHNPLVFISSVTHALYPTGGIKLRVWGAVADVCPDDTAEPMIYALHYLPDSHPWRMWTGSMGRDGIGSIGNHGRLSLPSSQTNHIRTAWRRRLFRLP
jgi:hypothetical protein